MVEIASRFQRLKSAVPFIGGGSPAFVFPEFHHSELHPVEVDAILRFHTIGKTVGAIRLVETYIFQPNENAQRIVRGVAYHVTHGLIDSLPLVGGLHRYPTDPRSYYHPAYITPRDLDANSILEHGSEGILEISIEGYDTRGMPLGEIEKPVDCGSYMDLLRTIDKLIMERDGLLIGFELVNQELQAQFGNRYTEIISHGMNIRKVGDSVGGMRSGPEGSVRRPLGGYTAETERPLSASPQDDILNRFKRKQEEEARQ